MVNKVILIGRLGADPEVRYTQNGTPVSNFKLATNTFWKDNEGERHKNTDWHKCTCWGRLAEVAGEYLKKGDEVYILGRLSYGQYERDGQTVYYSYVHVEEMKFVDVKTRPEKEDIEFPKGGNNSVREDAPF